LNRTHFDECFYEKVVKVKADVAALLNLFFDVSIDVRWWLSRAPEGAFILTLDSP